MHTLSIDMYVRGQESHALVHGGRELGAEQAALRVLAVLEHGTLALLQGPWLKEWLRAGGHWLWVRV
jgi:predicted DCC family thiol-disulfide oxidoreductase YuxK